MSVALMRTGRSKHAGRLGLAGAILMAAPALAHDWYPHACCHELDCAPVDRAETLPDGSLRLTSRVGTTDVPQSFPRQDSPDGQMHICMVRYSHLDGMRPVCFFVPPPGPKQRPS